MMNTLSLALLFLSLGLMIAAIVLPRSRYGRGLASDGLAAAASIAGAGMGATAGSYLVAGFFGAWFVFDVVLMIKRFRSSRPAP